MSASLERAAETLVHYLRLALAESNVRLSSDSEAELSDAIAAFKAVDEDLADRGR